MPAFYAHKRFGEAVIATLPPAFQENIQKYIDAFRLGTQGPDILFYHHPIRANAVRQKGVDLHHQSAEAFFLTQAQRLLDSDRVKEQDGNLVPASAYAAYIAGFICHFTLDVFVHPHVYERQATGVSHGKIESEFDKYIFRKDNLPIRGHHVAKQLTIENGTDTACALALDISADEAQLAIKTMRKINEMFACKCEAFHALAHGILKIAKMDEKFGDMFLHKKDDPRCDDLNPVLYQDLEAAIPKAAALIEDYFTRIHKHVENGKLDEFFRHMYTGEKCHD